MKPTDKFLPFFLDMLIETNYFRQTQALDLFDKQIDFESYKKGFYDAFKELDLL